METRRIGFRPASRDGLPLLGPLGECPDVFVATGFGSSGLTLAPFAAISITLILVVFIGESVRVHSRVRNQDSLQAIQHQ